MLLTLIYVLRKISKIHALFGEEEKVSNINKYLEEKNNKIHGHIWGCKENYYA